MIKGFMFTVGVALALVWLHSCFGMPIPGVR